MTADYLLHLAAGSGGILYVMALLLTVALTVIIERTWYLHRLLRKGDELVGALAGQRHLDRHRLETLREDSVCYPHGALLCAAIETIDAGAADRMADFLEEAIMAEAAHIDRRMWLLDTIVTLAPLLGLLGTIIGMFNSFEVLGRPGSAPTEITGGIAEALVATASGLFIAIVGLVFFNALGNHVRQIVHHLERIKVMLVNRLADAAPSQRPLVVSGPVSADGSLHALSAAARI